MAGMLIPGSKRRFVILRAFAPFLSLSPFSARLCGPENALSSAEQEKAQDGGDDFVEPRHIYHLLAFFFTPSPLF